MNLTVKVLLSILTFTGLLLGGCIVFYVVYMEDKLIINANCIVIKCECSQFPEKKCVWNSTEILVNITFKLTEGSNYNITEEFALNVTSPPLEIPCYYINNNPVNTLTGNRLEYPTDILGTSITILIFTFLLLAGIIVIVLINLKYRDTVFKQSIVDPVINRDNPVREYGTRV